MKSTGCPYCDLAIKAGQLFCSRHSKNMRNLRSGIFLIRQQQLEECDWHVTRLSLNFNLDGPQTYFAGSRQYQIEPAKYLLINEGQSFKTSLNSDRVNRMLTIAFQVGLAEEIYSSMTSKTERLLDDPLSDNGSISFFEGNHALTPAIQTKITDLINNSLPEDQLQDELDSLLALIISEQLKLVEDALLIEKIKPSTRVEIFRRLRWSMDFLQDNYTHPLTVSQLAEQACLSIYHFKRMFHQVYGEAPYQCIKRLRLEKADSLLKFGMPVKSVCKAVGWQDPSSFVRLFRKKNLVTPLEFARGQHADV